MEGVRNGVKEEDQHKCGAAIALLTMPLGKEKPLVHVASQQGSWPHRLKGCKRTPASLPQGSAMWFWIKSRSLAERGQLGPAGIQTGICPAKLHTSISLPGRQDP